MPPLDPKNSNSFSVEPNNEQVNPLNTLIKKDILLQKDLYKKEIDPVFQSKSFLKPTPPTFSKISPGIYSVLKSQEPIAVSTPTKVQNLDTNPFQKSIPTTPAVKPIIRTFRSDVESAIKVDHWSSVNIALAEKERARQQEQNIVKEVSQGSNKKTPLIIGVSVLLIALGLGIFFIPSLMKQNTAVETINIKPYSLITPEYSQKINIDNVAQNIFASSLGQKIKSLDILINTVQEFYFTKGQGLNEVLLNSANFANLSNLNMPDQLVRALNPEYMIGAYSYGTSRPFLIFKTSSFENTFAGMISWETNMRNGLSQIFALPTETQTINEKTGQDKFIDMVIQNKDVRILKNSTNQTILLYSIIDKNTIVITTNEQVFKEILARLNREKSLAR